jgi:hypothetical protein
MERSSFLFSFPCLVTPFVIPQWRTFITNNLGIDASYFIDGIASISWCWILNALLSSFSASTEVSICFLPVSYWYLVPVLVLVSKLIKVGSAPILIIWGSNAGVMQPLQCRSGTAFFTSHQHCRSWRPDMSTSGNLEPPGRRRFHSPLSDGMPVSGGKLCRRHMRFRGSVVAKVRPVVVFDDFCCCLSWIRCDDGTLVFATWGAFIIATL